VIIPARAGSTTPGRAPTAPLQDHPRTFTPLPAPARLADTRVGGTTVDRQFRATGQVRPGVPLQLTVGGRAGVPVNASTVSLNVTVTNPGGWGFLTVYPCGQAPPLASNLNYGPGQTIPNAVIASLGTAGKVCFKTLVPTDLVVDVAGCFPG
jgi:hypothetical protein